MITKVELYGGDQSPWVQAVSLGLHEKGIEYSLRSLPPFAVFRRWGVLMPAVSIDGGAWEIESSEILTKLGFDPIPKEDLKAVRRALQGVLHRADDPLRFFSAFSLVRHSSVSRVRQSIVSFFWSFTAFYMFTLLNIAKRTGQLRDPEDFGEQYLYWESALEVSNGAFIDGHTPGARDLLLFGVVQCHSSIPVPPLEPLRSDGRLRRLRAWITTMQEHFADYPHLYSGRYFAPECSQPTPAGHAQRAFFWLGLVLMWVAFPVTLALVFFLMARVPR